MTSDPGRSRGLAPPERPLPEPSRSGLPARRRGPAIRAGAATLAVLALLVAAAPWLVGVRTEHAYEQFLAGKLPDDALSEDALKASLAGVPEV